MPMNENSEAAKILRRQYAGEVMNEPVAIVAGTPIPNRVLAEQSYTAPGRLTEEERVTIEKGARPSRMSRAVGLALGAIFGAGAVVVSAILVVKLVIWAWEL